MSAYLDPKPCTECGRVLPRSAFHSNGRYVASRCKECANARKRAQYERDPGRQKESTRAWRQRGEGHGMTASEAETLRLVYALGMGYAPEQIKVFSHGGHNGWCVQVREADGRHERFYSISGWINRARERKPQLG